VFADNTLDELICYKRPFSIFDNIPVRFEECTQRVVIPRIQGTTLNTALVFCTDSSAKATALEVRCYLSGFVSCADNGVEWKVAERFCSTDLK